MKFVLLINVKMPTIVGIFNLLAGSITGFVKLKISIDFGYFGIYEQFKIHTQLSLSMKKSFIFSEPGLYELQTFISDTVFPCLLVLMCFHKIFEIGVGNCLKSSVTGAEST